MKISDLLRDLTTIYVDKGDVEVCVKQSNGEYNTKLDVGWDGGHVIGTDDATVAVIACYVYMRGASEDVNENRLTN